MKNLSHFTFIILLVFGLGITAAAQTTTVSPDKRAAIAELLTATKVFDQMQKAMESTMLGMEDQMPAIMRSSLDRVDGLTPADKEMLLKDVVEKSQVIGKKFRQRFFAEIDMKAFVEENYYPLYDKYFTLQEIKDMTAFYRTPTGQKAIDSMPMLLDESTKISFTKLTPKILKIVDEIISEETKDLGRPASAKQN
jgi:hypothetical protein